MSILAFRRVDTDSFSGEDNCAMGNTLQCGIHGERQNAFVCSHLVGETAGLGFNRSEPTADCPFPDAWCDDCELIRASHGGWTEESEKLLRVVLVCSECYRLICIRNTRTTTTFDELSKLRWKCSSCDEWHTGPCLDFTYDSPIYWTKQHEEIAHRTVLMPSWSRNIRPGTFLNEDYCAIDDRDFFIRGIIKLPIIGTREDFCWGVWGSASRQNFDLLLAKEDDPNRSEIPPVFSWLSNQICEYPDTLNLKMNAHIQKPNDRPYFTLELTDHPLSHEHHNGISPQRVREIMLRRLREAGYDEG